MGKFLPVTFLCGLPIWGQVVQGQAVAPPPGVGGGGAVMTVTAGLGPQELSEEEITTVEKRVADYPADVDSRILLIRMYMQKREFTKAEPHAWWVLENRPDHGAMSMAISVLTMERGDGTTPQMDRVERILEGHLEKRGDDPRLLMNLAQFYQRTSYQKAEEVLLKARKLPPQTPSYPADMITMRLASLYAWALQMENLPNGRGIPADAALLAARVKGRLLSTEDPMLSGFTGFHLAMVVSRPRPESTNEPSLAELKLLAERLLQIGLDANPEQQQFKMGVDRLQGRMPESGTGGGDAAPGRITVGSGVQSQMLEHRVAAEYPPLAAQARVSGTVRLNVVVGKDGSVQNVQLTSGHPLLVESAVKAVRQYRYRPTLLNGQAVEVVTQVDVNFQSPQ